ncbi:hypothetical protein CI238_13123, partial [Colletotrichum incanum]
LLRTGEDPSDLTMSDNALGENCLANYDKHPDMSYDDRRFSVTPPNSAEHAAERGREDVLPEEDIFAVSMTIGVFDTPNVFGALHDMCPSPPFPSPATLALLVPDPMLGDPTKQGGQGNGADPASVSDPPHGAHPFGNPPSLLQCACVEKAILLHEDINLHIIWPLRNINQMIFNNKTIFDVAQRVILIEMLRCLKRSLTRHQELLDCLTNHPDSCVVTLVISMCDMMVCGVGFLSDVLNEDMACLSSFGYWSATEPGIANAFPSSAKGLYDAAGGKPNFDHDPFVSGWDLEKDDELRVWCSLVAARSRRLCGLVERLRKVTTLTGRPVQNNAVQSLQGRINTIHRAAERRDAESSCVMEMSV